MQLSNKKALVTGGTSGLGLALSKLLVEKGVQVIALGKSSESVTSAKEIIPNLLFTATQLDITNYGELSTLITKEGYFDIVMNVAGIWLEGSLEDNDPEKIKSVIETNLTGLIYVTQATLPAMKAQDEGYIINVASTSGIKPRGDKQAVYAASKWGVQGFTESLKLELIDTHIKVFGVYPGGMDTSLFAKAGTPKNNQNWMDPMDVAQVIVDNLEKVDKLHIDHIVINRLAK